MFKSYFSKLSAFSQSKSTSIYRHLSLAVLFELSHIREITKYRLNSSKHVWVLFEPGVKVKVKAHACRCEDRSFVAFFFSLELIFLCHW